MCKKDNQNTQGVELEFQSYLAKGEFKIQRCGACGKSVFYPRMICVHCGDASQLEWYKPSGKGTVYSTTVIHQRPEKGSNYNVALIDLQEGPRMMSRVQGVDPQDVVIGLAVTAKVIHENGANLVVFEPMKGHQHAR